MARWSPLRERLASIEDQVTLPWAELDALVGGLPVSAYEHAAFWSGDRSGWPGFTTEGVRVGEQVTFVRRSGDHSAGRPSPPVRAVQSLRASNAGPPDLVLVGCVKTKLSYAAAAKDLYISPLFRKERRCAEATGASWLILSALHGAVRPDDLLEPYNLRLSDVGRAYRRKWGERVVEQLGATSLSLEGATVEIHAGAAYSDAIRDGLLAAGAIVVEPLAGLTMGERLRWYGLDTANPHRATIPAAGATASLIADFIRALSDDVRSVRPSEFLASQGEGYRSAGLYSWWVDAEGAARLSAGLDREFVPGLIYAGQAGATRSRSGRRSTNTLWGRIRGMHLAGNHAFSTFRLSLGSILAQVDGTTQIDEQALTSWMHEHLRVIGVPVENADHLDDLGSRVLAGLDPPLNLSKMKRTPIRARLTELRRLHK